MFATRLISRFLVYSCLTSDFTLRVQSLILNPAMSSVCKLPHYIDDEINPCIYNTVILPMDLQLALGTTSRDDKLKSKVF